VTALADEIKRLIAHEGPMSVERYMALALYDPRHGYYMTRDPFGEAGDFTTAPEISQMFGELIGLWVADVARHLPASGTVRLVELGPGRGTLMADALRALKIVPALRARMSVHLVETSPVLRARQYGMLRECGLPMTWHERHDEIPEGPAIFIANEFFDALPIRQFVRMEHGWCERLIGLDANGALTYGLAAEPETKPFAREPVGTLVELSPTGITVIGDLGERFKRSKGAALIIDYAHANHGRGDTFQAVRRHAFADPLADTGEADLTAHVNYAALWQIAAASGAAVHGPVTQRWFLHTIGLKARVRALKRKADERQRAAVSAAARRLAGRREGEMGEPFVALAIAHPSLPLLPGFDRRRSPEEVIAALPPLDPT
jgi:SAM-dependent MidA family methyltransferase